MGEEEFSEVDEIGEYLLADGTALLRMELATIEIFISESGREEHGVARSSYGVGA